MGKAAMLGLYSGRGRRMSTQSERTAESLIAFETALEPLYRAKNHKPPMSKRDKKELEAAIRTQKEGAILRKDIEEGNRLAARIRKGGEA